jgi:hypothetical protein
MRISVVSIALLLTIMALADTGNRVQAQAAKEMTRSLLWHCLSADSFQGCSSENGVQCQDVADGGNPDYRCVTYVSIHFSEDRQRPAPPGVSTELKVVFRVFFASQKWNVGPVSMTSVED